MVENLFRNGKLVEAWHTWDMLSMLQQLGILPTIDKLASIAAHPH